MRIIGVEHHATRQTYQGPLVIGEDLMSFDIGASGIAIYRSGS